MTWNWWAKAAVAAASISLLALSFSCDGGGEQPSPTATITPGPALSPTPIATAAATAPPRAASPAVTLDLADTAPLMTIFAADPDDLHSDVPAVATADVNGDGLNDLLLGARAGDGPENGRQDAGEAYVIYGSRTLGGSLDLRQGQQDITIYGAKVGDGLGFSVLGGDVNGDGTDDIAVSAPFSNGPFNERTDPGEVYVFFGRPDFNAVIDLASDEPDVRIVAAEGFALFGDSLSIADVNDDGIVDIIGGAPFAGREAGAPVGGPRTEVGAVYVVFGSPTLGGVIRAGVDEQYFTLASGERLSELGDNVASADVNDDGIADIIAAAEAADGPDGERVNAGEVYVVFGSPELGGTVSTAEGQQNLTVLGAEPQDTLGFNMVTGDVNGDGIDDIILCARLADGPGNGRDTSGEAYVVFGSRSLGGTIDVAQAQEDVTIFPAVDHLLIVAIASGDLNGDGISDIVLGTRYTGRRPPAGATAGTPGGEVYVLYGSRDLAGDVDLLRRGVDIAVLGAEPGDALGAAAAVADVNGDGVNELILVADGAAGPDNARAGAGEVYILSGLGGG